MRGKKAGLLGREVSVTLAIFLSMIFKGCPKDLKLSLHI